MALIRDLHEGRLLVATDLQGNWEDYERIREQHHHLRQAGEVDYLVLDGDLIHADNLAQDRSKEILDDLIDHPDGKVISLLGNHELMHLYHIPITRQDLGRDFAESLEEQIEGNRERYISFFRQMPYAIRTPAGVTINHTGANPPLAGFYAEDYVQLVQGKCAFELMESLRHQELLSNVTKLTKEVMEHHTGQKLADDFFDDYSPQIGSVFLQTPIGKYLWDVFFNMNERQFGPDLYDTMLSKFLETMAHHGQMPQRFLVAGHMVAPRGYQVVHKKQLRISSSYAVNDNDKTLLIVDAARPCESMEQLVRGWIPLEKKK